LPVSRIDTLMSSGNASKRIFPRWLVSSLLDHCRRFDFSGVPHLLSRNVDLLHWHRNFDGSSFRVECICNELHQALAQGGVHVDAQGLQHATLDAHSERSGLVVRCSQLSRNSGVIDCRILNSAIRRLIHFLLSHIPS
jgi:hypothetical protein